MSLPSSDDQLVQDWSACVLLLEMQTLLMVDMQLYAGDTSHTVFQIVTQQTSQSNRRHKRKVFISTIDNM